MNNAHVFIVGFVCGFIVMALLNVYMAYLDELEKNE